MRAGEFGVTPRVRWMGAQSEDTVRHALREADIFALTPHVAADGDRDGLPNVLVEAQIQSLPVVATAVGGVGELVEDGLNGLLCPPHQPTAIAAALGRLIRQPETRAAMGAAGRLKVERDFPARPGADAIASLLPTHLGPA